MKNEFMGTIDVNFKHVNFQGNLIVKFPWSSFGFGPEIPDSTRL
jgi:hypothetical protein